MEIGIKGALQIRFLTKDEVEEVVVKFVKQVDEY